MKCGVDSEARAFKEALKRGVGRCGKAAEAEEGEKGMSRERCGIIRFKGRRIE